MSAPVPAVVVRFGLEEPPDIYLDVKNDAELLRLCDWVDAHPEFLRLIAQLFALAERERTA